MRACVEQSRVIYLFLDFFFLSTPSSLHVLPMPMRICIDVYVSAIQCQAFLDTHIVFMCVHQSRALLISLFRRNEKRNQYEMKCNIKSVNKILLQKMDEKCRSLAAMEIE